jgi:nucleotide-binding universal stress UspA family protein
MHVLYALDGGEAARAAAELLVRIGRRDRIDVTVLSVSDLKGIDTGVTLDDPTGPIEKSRKATAELVRQTTGSLSRAGFTVKGQVAEGSPAVEIARLLEAHPHDIILIGAGNKTWLDRLLHGSVSTHLLHSSATSVLVVHETTSHRNVRVLVADDGSESATAASELLVELGQTDTCEVTVMGVVTLRDLSVVPDRAILMPESIPVDSVEIANLENAQIAKVRERVEKTAAALRTAGFRVDHKVAVGHPAAEILKTANDGDYDLVAMGSPGLGAVGSALLGSVSDAVSRHARAPLVSQEPSSED